MIKKEIRLYQGGKFTVTFFSKREYKKYANIYYLCIGFFAATFVLVTSGLLLFILLLTYNSNSNLLLTGILLLLSAAATNKIYLLINNRLDNIKYNLVINEIKLNKWKISYSNKITGHITYVLNGEHNHIYVFKGKNAKSAK